MIAFSFPMTVHLRRRTPCRLLLLSLAFLLPAIAAQARDLSAIAAVDATHCRALQNNGVLRASAPVSCEQLRIVRFAYLDFEGKQHNDGEIMVMAAAAEHVQALFAELLTRRFPIAAARQMQTYRGDDQASMRANNTSAFNDRAITNASAPSLHAYGLAIDINPVQNPFIEVGKDGKASISPVAGRTYLNRQSTRPGKPARKGMAEEVVDLLAMHGFTIWGGDWDAPLDYQHFQVSRSLAKKLAALPEAQARAAFDAHVADYRKCIAGKPSATARLQCAVP